ncbi:MAG: twin-arginine translocation pathway signal [Methylacidiphilales bacterium]|nr:twin-arginine translocation pathway signal [Candidatus Methylacidiphilales bacterium]
MRARFRGLIAAAVVAAAVPFAATALAKPKSLPVEPVALVVRATPITSFDPHEPERTRFGRLEFRGGLELSADNPAFGGWSALHLDATGERVLAASDAGVWLTGRLLYDQGRLSGLREVRIAAMRGSAGETLTRIGRADVESLAVDGSTCYVGIERVHEIRRYDCSGAPFASRGIPQPVPSALKKMPRNSGLEALVAMPRDLGGTGSALAGSLIGITETGETGEDDSLGFIIRGSRFATFRVKRSDDFSITDAALAGSDLLLLERHFSLLRGVSLRVRRIPLSAIEPGAVVDGEVLMTAGRGQQIDNMEGLAVHTNAAGETILTMISDDNFSFLQRTLILQFALRD